MLEWAVEQHEGRKTGPLLVYIRDARVSRDGGQLLVAGMNPAVHAASRDLAPQVGRAMVYARVSLAFPVGALRATGI